MKIHLKRRLQNGVHFILVGFNVLKVKCLHEFMFHCNLRYFIDSHAELIKCDGADLYVFMYSVS